MTRSRVGLVLAVGTLFAACQTAPGKNASDQRTQELEKRVAELEHKATPEPSPASAASAEPAAQVQAEVDAATAAPAAEAPRAPAHPPARAAAPARRAPAPLPAPPSRVDGPVVASGDPGPARVSAPPEPMDPPREAAEPARVVVREEPPVEQVSVPAGTQLSLVLETALSSATSHAGDKVTARVERATGEDGRVLLPGGTVMRGHVVDARPSGRVSGKARVVVAFDEIVVRGRAQRLDTTEIEAVASDSHERDGAIVGGGVAAGAIIGGITGGGKGAGKGAVIGGLAGTGAVLATKGKEIDMPAGSRWTVKVRDGVRF
jgi:type IV secretory pathway VirB10-like protein